MLGHSFEKLLSIASPPLLNVDDDIDMRILNAAGAHADDIAAVLGKRNGFFAFESALRFFPSRSVPISYGLEDWNDPKLWRFEYANLMEVFFFAEDIFGNQFCVSAGTICSFDPETGEVGELASSLEEWAKIILSDYDVLTGYNLAHEWQSKYGRLSGRNRLVPKIPFVTGGEFSLPNLVALEAVRGMRARGNFAQQIRSLPDGAKVRFMIPPLDEKPSS